MAKTRQLILLLFTFQHIILAERGAERGTGRNDDDYRIEPRLFGFGLHRDVHFGIGHPGRPSIFQRPNIVQTRPTVIESSPTIIRQSPVMIERGPTIVQQPSYIQSRPNVIETGPNIVRQQPFIQSAPQIINQGPTIVEQQREYTQQGPIMHGETQVVNEESEQVVEEVKRHVIEEKIPTIVKTKTPTYIQQTMQQQVVREQVPEVVQEQHTEYVTQTKPVYVTETKPVTVTRENVVMKERERVIHTPGAPIITKGPTTVTREVGQSSMNYVGGGGPQGMMPGGGLLGFRMFDGGNDKSEGVRGGEDAQMTSDEQSGSPMRANENGSARNAEEAQRMSEENPEKENKIGTARSTDEVQMMSDEQNGLLMIANKMGAERNTEDAQRNGNAEAAKMMSDEQNGLPMRANGMGAERNAEDAQRMEMRGNQIETTKSAEDAQMMSDEENQEPIIKEEDIRRAAHGPSRSLRFQHIRRRPANRNWKPYDHVRRSQGEPELFKIAPRFFGFHYRRSKEIYFG